jgi:hypothetical protein
MGASRPVPLLPALACAALVLVLRAGPALAADPQPRALEPAAVEGVLGRQGYRDIRILQRRGNLWLADADAPRGRRMRAVVDATTGEIAGLKPLDGHPPDPPGDR